MNRCRWWVVLAFGLALPTWGQEIEIDPGAQAQIDLARQLELANRAGEIVEALTALRGLPPEAVDILFDTERTSVERLKAVARIVHQASPTVVGSALDGTAGNAGRGGTQSISTNNRPVPRLTADNIVYVEAPTTDVPGMIIVSYEDQTYIASVGDEFSIRGKRYQVVDVNYLSDTTMEVVLRTKAGDSSLQVKI